MEQYIEAIAKLLTREKVCSVSAIAEGTGVSRAAVSRAVRDLAGKGLVEHKSYGYVDLTPRGHRLAAELAARHQALFEFLSEVLGYDDEAADNEACHLEHLLDDPLVDRLALLTSFFRGEAASGARWQRFLERQRQPERV